MGYTIRYALTYVVPLGSAAIIWNTTHNTAATWVVGIGLTLVSLAMFDTWTQRRRRRGRH